MPKFNAPRPIHIYAEWDDGKHSGIARLKPANTIEEARRIIVEDRAAMSNTFNGFIEPNTGTRTYRIFRAVWSEITDEI